MEYVGHDLTARGNCPAQSRFDLINDWTLPKTGQTLHSFVGLLNFYHHYKPHLELRIKPLRELYKRFYRSVIPIMGWTTELIQLFEDLTSQSKFDMINDWPLPKTGQTLHSFIGLLNFYHHYKPQLEMRMRPLRELYKQFYG